MLPETPTKVHGHTITFLDFQYKSPLITRAELKKTVFIVYLDNHILSWCFLSPKKNTDERSHFFLPTGKLLTDAAYSNEGIKIVLQHPEKNFTFGCTYLDF